MDRKSHLLSHLKKQVLTLRNQLERIVNTQPTLHTPNHNHSKHNNSKHNSSITHSPRFDSVSLDSTYL